MECTSSLLSRCHTFWPVLYLNFLVFFLVLVLYFISQICIYIFYQFDLLGFLQVCTFWFIKKCWNFFKVLILKVRAVWGEVTEIKCFWIQIWKIKFFNTNKGNRCLLCKCVKAMLQLRTSLLWFLFWLNAWSNAWLNTWSNECWFFLQFYSLS